MPNQYDAACEGVSRTTTSAEKLALWITNVFQWIHATHLVFLQSLEKEKSQKGKI